MSYTTHKQSQNLDILGNIEILAILVWEKWHVWSPYVQGPKKYRFSVPIPNPKLAKNINK